MFVMDIKPVLLRDLAAAGQYMHTYNTAVASPMNFVHKAIFSVGPKM